MRRRDDDPGSGRPRTIGELLPEALAAAGLTEAVARAQAMAAWPTAVGARIAAVTEPRLLTEDGTLVVGVRTHAWMTELSLMEPQLLARLAGAAVTHPVRRLRWELLRAP